MITREPDLLLLHVCQYCGASWTQRGNVKTGDCGCVKNATADRAGIMVRPVDPLGPGPGSLEPQPVGAEGVLHPGPTACMECEREASECWDGEELCSCPCHR